MRPWNERRSFTSERPRCCAHAPSTTKPSWPLRSIIPFSTRPMREGCREDEILYPRPNRSVTLQLDTALDRRKPWH